MDDRTNIRMKKQFCWQIQNTKLNENQIFISQQKKPSKEKSSNYKKKNNDDANIIRKEIKNQLIRDNEIIIKFKKVRIM